MSFFKNLIEQSLNRTREATLGVLGIPNAGLRHHLSEQMVDELGAEGCFLAPPVFEHTFGWKESESTTLRDLEGILLSKTLLDTLLDGSAKPMPYKFKPSQRPYLHQLQAWKTMLDPQPHSVVITSGTGSGKTECFMIPILEDLIRERERNRAGLVGVRALFLYPLNALINSQQERLDVWTRDFGKDVRFCLYNGKTKENASAVRKEQAEKPNQILSRELLRNEPAPILMTNATMLEYMLVRQVDYPILDISNRAKSLRWIVLDEAHTYIGSQAAEMSLLLRRVVQAFGKHPEELRFIATSATIAGADAGVRLQQYLADLAGVRLEQVTVISGSRVWPDLTQGAGTQTVSLANLTAIEPEKPISLLRHDVLKQSQIASTLRHEVTARGTPLNLNELVGLVADKLVGTNTVARQKEVLDWLDVMTGTAPKEGEPTFLKLRIHLFQRMLHGLWACIDPNCTSKSKHLENWPFGNVYVSQRTRCTCAAPVYELAFCNECKTPHLLAEDHKGELQQRSPYAGDEFTLNYETSDEEGVATDEQRKTNNEFSSSVILADYRQTDDPYVPYILDADKKVFGSIHAQRSVPLAFATADNVRCSNIHCKHEGTDGDFLRKAYLGAPFYVANAVPTVLEFCPDPDKDDCDGKSPEELPGRGRKLITFSDSRQGTARMAVRMQHEAERSRLRGLVFEILRNAQVKMDAQPKNAPRNDPDALIKIAETMEKIGMLGDAENYRRQAEALRSGAPRIEAVAQVDWQTMVYELSATKDIEQSILDYNKYANPVLFDGSQGSGTMARLLLAREFARRPKNQNSTETLGLIRVGYKGLDQITKLPAFWSESKATPANGNLMDEKPPLTLQDWQDFLKVVLDFYVRENTFISLDTNMQHWMGSRFSPKLLFPPKKDTIESSVIKKWPQVKSGNPSRLVKLLELATGLDRALAAHKDKINCWLESAWEALVSAHILEPADNGYTLKFDTFTFSLPPEGWVCPVTHRIFDTTFRGLTPYLPSKPLINDARCQKIQLASLSHLMPDGSATPKTIQIRNLVAQDPIIDQLRSENLWSDLCDRTVEGGFYYRTAEHSAQQSAEKLEKYVEYFKKGKVNVLNCSTTMEMGVDIGGISAVVMNNVPPHPANYLQRAGRAGRRSEARAIAYTLCKADPHNQRVFAQPKWPFITSIPAPSITLSSERIVARHVNSLLLATYLRSQTSNNGDRTKLTLQWFYAGEDSPCQQFISWLDNAQDEFADAVAKLVQGTCLEGRALHSIIAETQMAIQKLESYWLEELRKLDDKLAKAVDTPYKSALNLEKKRHEQEYLLRDLASRTFLPGYGFPTDVVNLNTYNIEDFKHERSNKGGNPSREDSIFDNKEKPSRSLAIAIREYAPGSQIVIDGRVYRSAGVSLQWHTDGQRKEAQKFSIAWRCPNCGASGLVENAYSNSDAIQCSHCQFDIPHQARKQVLRPEGFVTDFYESTTNDITTQKFIRVERPRIQLNGEAVALPDQRCGFIAFGHGGSVFYHSSGEHENGYAVCMACGRADSMTASGDVPTSLQVTEMHRPVGGIGGSHRKEDCSGEDVKKNLYLGYQIQTDVLEVFLRNPKTGEWLSDRDNSPIIASTLAVALRDTIADELGIASTEMGFAYRLDRDLESGQGRSVIQLFDQVSGGAGFVLACLNDITQLLKKAAEKLVCRANCENVCSCCLASKDSRVELEELDRKLAQQWLNEAGLLDYLNLPPELAVVPGATYCAVGPSRYLTSAINKLNRTDNSAFILLNLQGNTEDWELDHPSFRKRILTWAVADSLKIRLAVPSGIELSKEQKESLALFAKLGIEIAELETTSTAPVPTQPSLIAQICSQRGISSLYLSHLSAGVPGEAWIRSQSDIICANSLHIAALPTRLLDTSQWRQNSNGARVLEVTRELDGPVQNLPMRWRSFIDAQVPELGELLRHDQAISLTYSDRYLKSPWVLILLAGFLEVFRNKALTKLTLQTVAANSPQQPYRAEHDWRNQAIHEAMMQLWFGTRLGFAPTLGIKGASRDIQHGRVMTVEWASGKTSQIHLDQGMGYWHGRMPLKGHVGFDFSQPERDQFAQMTLAYEQGVMQQGGNWPSYIAFQSR